MTYDDTRLKDIFAETFGMDPEDISDTSSPETVAEWTSLSHLTLMSSVEAGLGVTFSVDEMTGIGSYSELRNVVSKQAG